MEWAITLGVIIIAPIILIPFITGLSKYGDEKGDVSYAAREFPGFMFFFWMYGYRLRDWIEDGDMRNEDRYYKKWGDK